MKKIMIALAAVAMAVAANAAAVTWASGAITLSDGSTLAVAGSATAYLWSVDKTTYNKYSSYTTGDALTKAIMEAYSGSLTSATVTQASVKKGNKANLLDTTTYAKGDTAYGIILYKDETAATDTYMGNIGSYAFDADASVSVDSMASFIGGNSAAGATAWVAAPEPTSGLLLLLGMAGLALKRKIA